VQQLDTQRGFTLIEAMITVLIAAILMAIAVPSFRTLTLNSQQRNAVADVNVMLSRIRTEVAARHRGVTACASNDQVTCSGAANWENGWIIFVDSDDDGTLDGGEVTVLVHPSLPSGSTLRTLGVLDRITYRRDGLPGAPATFVYCDERGLPSLRAVVVGQSGMVRIAQDGRDHTDTVIAACT
jgi:type IV fimbrial biogenesis protein FimT